MNPLRLAVVSTTDPGTMTALRSNPPAHVFDVSGGLPSDLEALAGYQGINW